MADDQKQMLNMLKQIERNTKNFASAKEMANNRRKGIGNQDQDTDDRFESATVGMINAFGNLRKEVENNKKAQKDQAQLSKDAAALRGAFQGSEKVIRQYIDQNKDLIGARSRLKDALITLGNSGVEVSDLLTDTDRIHSYEKLIETLNNASDRANGFADDLEGAGKRAQQSLDAASKARTNSIKNFVFQLGDAAASLVKSLGAAATAFSTLASEVSLETQRAGFGLGGPPAVEGDTVTDRILKMRKSLFGLVDGAVDAIGFGATAQELARFGADNRAELMATSGEAVNELSEISNNIIEEYANTLNQEFGFIGPQNLENISKSFKILGNLGIPITAENLEDLRQGVENMAKTSNMVADEVFAELANLAQDVDYQNLVLAFDSQESVMNILTESFINLQRAVGLNMKEFIEYQKFLAKQRQRTGSERMVQAGFTRRTATIAGFGQQDVNLLTRGAAFYESLSETARQEYDILIQEFRDRLSQMRRDIAGGAFDGEGTTGQATLGLQQLDILTRGSGLGGIEDLTLEGREESGLIDAVQKNQDELLAASRQSAGELEATNALVSKILKSFSTSVFSASLAAFFASMTGSVTTGNILADKVKVGGGVMSSSLKLLKGLGLVGTVGGASWMLGTALNEKFGWSDSLSEFATDIAGVPEDIRDTTVRNVQSDTPTYTANELVTMRDSLVEDVNRYAEQLEEAKSENRERAAGQLQERITDIVGRVTELTRSLQRIEEETTKPKPEKTLPSETPDSNSAFDARDGG